MTNFQEEEKGAGAAPAADGAAPAKAAAAPAAAEAAAAAAPVAAAPAKPLEAPAAEQYTVCGSRVQVFGRAPSVCARGCGACQGAGRRRLLSSTRGAVLGSGFWVGPPAGGRIAGAQCLRGCGLSCRAGFAHMLSWCSECLAAGRTDHQAVRCAGHLDKQQSLQCNSLRHFRAVGVCIATHGPAEG